MIRWITLSIGALLLAGCDSGIFGWLGEPDPPALPGDRIAVFSPDAALARDTVVAERTFSIPEPVLNDSWPQAGGNLNKSLHHVSAPGDWDVVWTRSLGQGESRYRRVVATPVIGDGRLFGFDADTRVTAIDEASGGVVWTFDVTPARESDGGWGGGLALDSGRLFVTTGFGEVIALDAVDGGEIWRTTIGPSIRTPPSVSDGRVHLVTSGNEVVTLNADSGQELWRYTGLSETASVLGGGAPAIVSSFVIAAQTSGEVTALRAENGRIVWSDSVAYQSALGGLTELNDINGSPVVDDDLVFVQGYTGLLIAIDLVTGIRVWERPLASSQTPWVAGDFVFQVTNQAEVVCLQREDGRVRWFTPLDRFLDPEDLEDPINWSGPVIAGGRLLVAGSHGVAAILSPESGEILETRNLPRGIPVAPVVSNETVYLVDASAVVSAYR